MNLLRCRTILRATAALVLVLGVLPAAHARVIVAFRYDDFVGCQVNNVEYGQAASRLQADEIVVGAFIARKLPLTIAIVPFASTDGKTPRGPLTEDPARMKLLRDAIAAGVLEPALHAIAPDDPYPFYEHLSRDGECDRIRLGKSSLEAWLGKPVDILVPPNHQYDRAAVEGADDAGISIISAGAKPPYPPVKSWLTVLYPGPIPIETVRQAAAYPEDCLIVVMLHPFDLKVNDFLHMAQFDATSFGAYVDAIVTTPGVEVHSMAEIAAKFPSLVNVAHQDAIVGGHEMLKTGKLYQPLVRMIWRDRPADVAWATSIWEPLASKRYLPHAVLGLLGLGLAALAWASPLRRELRLRLLLVLAPAAGCMAVGMSVAARGRGIGLSAQAVMVGLGVIALYGVFRYTDMIMLQMRRIKAKTPTRR